MCDYVIMLEKIYNPQCLKLNTLKDGIENCEDKLDAKEGDRHDFKINEVIQEDYEGEGSSGDLMNGSQLDEDAAGRNQVDNKQLSEGRQKMAARGSSPYFKHVSKLEDSKSQVQKIMTKQETGGASFLNQKQVVLEGGEDAAHEQIQVTLGSPNSDKMIFFPKIPMTALQGDKRVSLLQMDDDIRSGTFLDKLENMNMQREEL